MALVPIRIPRTSKPPFGTPIDSSNPLAQQLIGCLGVNEGGGPRLHGLPSSVDLTGGAWLGDAWSTNGTSDKGAGTLDLSPYNQITIEFILLWKSYNNNDSIFLEHRAAGNSTGSFILDPDSGSPVSGKFQISMFKAQVAPSGSSVQSVGFTRPAAGEYHHYIVTLDKSTTSSGIRVFVDGVAQVLTPVYNADIRSNFNSFPLNLFCRDGSSLFGDGSLKKLAFYKGILTQADATFLSANPWQIYEPEIVWVEVGGGTGITATIAAIQLAQAQSLAGSLAFTGSSESSQQPQTSALSALLSFRGETAEMQAANLQAIVASLSFSGSINQIQQAQQQAIYQALTAITGAVSQTQAAQISALTASLIFGGSSTQTQAVQTQALVSVLRFTGSTAQAQAAQHQAIEAILGAVAITGTVSQSQAIQLVTLSTFVNNPEHAVRVINIASGRYIQIAATGRTIPIIQ